MATSTQDLQNKLKLESELRPKIKKLNKKIINKFTEQYKLDNNVINVNEFDDELNNILIDHYKKTSNIFSDNISKTLPEDIKVTEEERQNIESTLLIYFLLQAKQKSIDINNTTQIDLNNSIVEASQDDQIQGLTGTEFILTVGVLASVFSARKLNARTETIVQTETQFAAETAKGTEAEILTGQSPSISSGSSTKTNAIKRWDTVGDSKVRTAHVIADSQEKPISEPFVVGDERLKWPGDTSLGASLKNIINCRCTAVYLKKNIINLRRSMQ